MFRVSFADSVLHRESLAPSSNRATSIHWVSGEAKQASFHPPLKLLVTFLGARGSVAFLLQRPPGSQVFRAVEVCTQTRTPKALAQPNGVDEKLLAYFVARIVAGSLLPLVLSSAFKKPVKLLWSRREKVVLATRATAPKYARRVEAKAKLFQ